MLTHLHTKSALFVGFNECTLDYRLQGDSVREYAPLCNQVPLVLYRGNNHMHINTTTAVRIALKVMVLQTGRV